MKLKILLLNFILLFISAPAIAETPLSRELLKSPIELKCGAVIKEWQGTQTVLAIQKMNRICNLVAKKFEPFLTRHGLKKAHSIPFKYSISLLIDGKDYRQLNDVRHRFAARKTDIIGYTTINSKYLFIMSNTRHRWFAGTFAHELFHAMSIHYGVLRAHHPTSDEVRSRVNERYAQQFERDVQARL